MFEAVELISVCNFFIPSSQKAGAHGSSAKVFLITNGHLCRSFSRLLAFEACRILFRLGCDVHVFDPSSLTVKDDVQHDHTKVQELCNLSCWSDGHVWVSPEQHGNLVGYPKPKDF